MGIRPAFRSLLRQPGFTLLAVLILALGIGANTAIFSVVNGVLLRPLSYPDPDRIVRVQTKWQNKNVGNYLSYPDLQDLRKQGDCFSALSYYYGDGISVVANNRGEYASIAVVMPSFFKALGVLPVRGRVFTEREAEQGRPPEAIVSAAYWNEHFHGQSVASAPTVTLLKQDLRVIGVMPPGFDFPNATGIWVPSWMDPNVPPDRSAGFAFVVARLKPGISLARAQQQIDTIGNSLALQYPGTNKEKRFLLTPLREQMVAHTRDTLKMLLLAVALVLLIACANVSNLFLARGAARTRELAVRVALGANRKQIFLQLGFESVCLALASAAAGLAIGAWCLQGLKHIAPAELPRVTDIRLDPAVLAFTLAVAAAAVFLSTLVPAWQASHVGPNSALAQSGRRGVVGAAPSRIRSALVIGEIAISVVLVIGAALLIRTLVAMGVVDPGFNPAHLLVVSASAPAVSQDDAKRNQARYVDPMLERLAATPGVRSAGAISPAPLSSSSTSFGSYIVEGQTMQDFAVTGPSALFIQASPSYFQTMKIPLVRGRFFTNHDDFNAPSVAIISAALARRSFGAVDPIGRKILCGADDRTMKWMTVVGVVGDVHAENLTERMPEIIYMPVDQHPQPDLQFAIRSEGNPLEMSNAVRKLSSSLDPQVALRITSMETLMHGSVSTARFRAMVLGIFAGLALLLSTAGIYAVMAFSVTQRMAEIGVRMALGAESSDVVSMILGQIARLTLIGLGAGIVLSLFASRLLRSFLFHVPTIDSFSYVAMAGVLIAAAAIAGFVPAWRATRIDPIVALHEE